MIEGKTPGITLEQARADVGRSVDSGHVARPLDRALLATLADTVRRAGAVARLRPGDFQHDGTQYVPGFSEKAGKRREIPCGTISKATSWAVSTPQRFRVKIRTGRYSARPWEPRSA